MSTTLRLFLGIFAVLVFASSVALALRYSVAKGRPHAVIDNLIDRINAWWFMVALVALAFAFGKGGVIVLFGLLSLLALREFVTLTYTRRSDHLALAMVFYVALPMQYALIWIEWYGMYSIFIPVYGFLFLPIISALRADTTRFLDRIADDRRFTAEVTRGLVLLSPLGHEGLRRALVRPIELAGYRFEGDELVDEMLAMLARTRSPLPLLQFTATLLWEARDGARRLISRASYDALGGVAGALSTHADAVLMTLSPREQREFCQKLGLPATSATPPHPASSGAQPPAG